MRPTILVILLVLCGLASPISSARAAEEAVAADAADSADPAVLFAEAQRRFDDGDYEAALPLFRKAYEATRSPNARIYVARCLRELGRLTAAYDEMHATMREATEKAEQDDKYVPTRDAAAAELAMLEPRVAKLIVTVRDEVEGMELSLNDRTLASDRLGVPRTVEPGLQQVVVTAPNRKRARHEVDLKGGQTRTLTVAPGALLSGEGPTGPKPPGGTPPPDGSEATGGGVRIAGFVVGGLGLAALGVMIGTNVAADAELDTLERECGTERCTDPSYADTVDRGQTLETVANVSLVAGAVLLAGGIGMIIFGGPTTPDADETALRVVPGLSTEGAYLGLHGAF